MVGRVRAGVFLFACPPSFLLALVLRLPPLVFSCCYSVNNQATFTFLLALLDIFFPIIGHYG